MTSTCRKGRWPGWLLLLPLLLVGVAMSESVGPLLPGCLFYERTGMWCPGCGATRAAMALRGGEIVEALRNNVIFVTGVLAGGVWLLGAGLRERFPEAKFLKPFEFRLWFLWVALGVLVFFWVVRNFPGLEWLGPVGD